jgi:hypothetical protein
MSRGARDFSIYGALDERLAVNDLGELAARLNPVNVYHRGGYVLFWDDFSEGIGAWAVDAALGTYHTKLSVGRTLVGGYSYEIFISHTANDGVFVHRYYNYKGASRFGAEVSYSLVNASRYVLVDLDWFDTAGLYKFRFRHDTDLDKIYIYDGATDTNIELADVPAPETSVPAFTNIKMIVDTETLKYRSLFWNELAFDISDYDAWDLAGADRAGLDLTVLIGSKANIDLTAYIDYAILTAGEI